MLRKWIVCEQIFLLIDELLERETKVSCLDILDSLFDLNTCFI